MTSHLNSKQLEEKIASYHYQIEQWKQNIAQADDTNKHYWQVHIDGAQKAIHEFEAQMAIRKQGMYYDVLIKDLYKIQWSKVLYGQAAEKVSLFSDDVIGLELEYEGMNLHCNPVNYWKENSENSLRPYCGHPPVEYVLIKPLIRSELDKALNYLDKKLKGQSANPIVSPRTSTHVHLNAQNMSWKQITTWFVVYALVEDILVEFSGKERIGNLFCLRTRDTHYFIQCLESAIKNESYSLVTNSDLRYTSMNLASIEKFGSAEFRSMRSPISFDQIGQWVDILIAIKKASLTWKTPNEVVEFFEKFGAQATLKRIFPVTWMYELFDRPDLSAIMWEAIREVKDVAFASDWLSKKQPQPEKEKASPAEQGQAYNELFGLPNMPSFEDDSWV